MSVPRFYMKNAGFSSRTAILLGLTGATLAKKLVLKLR